MIGAIARRLFGSANDRFLKSLQPLVDAINAAEPSLVALSDDELRGILVANDPSAACTQMIHLANERGGEDNLTAVVALVEGDSLNAPFPNETVTGTFSVIKDFGRPRK